MVAAKRRAPVRKRKPAVTSADASRRSRNGKLAESIVGAYNLAARVTNVAVVTKIPTPTAYTPQGLRYSERSTTDYAGWLRGGRAIVIESKSVASTRRFSLTDVKPHQRKHLDAALRDGAVAVLVVVLGPEGFVCEVPWQDARGKVSMTRDELLTYRVKPTEYLRRFLREVIVTLDGTTGVVDAPKKMSGAEFVKAAGSGGSK